MSENGFGKDPRIEQVRVQVVKLAGDSSPQQTNSIQALEDEAKWFENQGALDPPYDPRLLVVLYEHSNALRQNVDAYATNIDGFGHTFQAVIDLESDSTIDDVRTLIALERQTDASVEQVEEPSEQEVADRIKQLANEQRLESLRLAAFFDDCSGEMSFVDLRRRKREDEEITGNAYWEVLRDRAERIAGFSHVESFTVRLCRLDDEFTEYTQKRRTLTQAFEDVRRFKRFRKFVQKVGTRAVYFKEFGDPRIMSSATGKVYENEAKMIEEEGKVRPATEMMHFKIPSSRSAYGIPRWIGNLLSVMGSRQSEDVNFQYFENKSVPPLAVLVSGGRLTKDSVEKLESFIKNEIRGKENFHKILIIEAEGSESNSFENSGRMKIELKPLTEAQTSDALFQQYDERNIDKVGMSFRVPRMLRGDTRDFNRSTAMAALDFAERQVFEPERTSFDFRMNRDVLPTLGIRHWKLKSNGPTQRDPESLAKMIHDLQDFLTPNILMELSQGVFNRNFPRIDADWADQPLKLTLAKVNKEEPDDGGDSPEAEDANPDNQGADPTTSTLETADNKTVKPGSSQGRKPDGKFGDRMNAPKPAVPKKRPTPARKGMEDPLASVAHLLVDVRDRLRSAVVDAAGRRIDQQRKADNDNADQPALDLDA